MVGRFHLSNDIEKSKNPVGYCYQLLIFIIFVLGKSYTETSIFKYFDYFNLTYNFFIS